MSNACIGTLRSFSVVSLGFHAKSTASCLVSTSIPCLRCTSTGESLVRRFRTLVPSHSCTPCREHLEGDRFQWRSRESPLPLLVRPFHTSRTLPHPLPPRRNKNPSDSSRKALAPSTSSKALTAFDKLSRADLKVIFGADAGSAADAISVLKTLHGRRVDGSLIDHGIQIQDNPIREDAKMRALKWLRQKYPVDEQSAATAYSGREAEELSNSYIARAERLGLYKPLDSQTAAQSGRSAKVSEYSGVNTERSVLEDYRLYNEEKRRREEEEKEKSGENKRNEELRIAKIEERQKSLEAKMEKRRQQEIASYATPPDMTEIPEMTKIKRLGPTTLVAAFSTLMLIIYAYNYTRPLRSTRVFPELPMSIATFLGIGITCMIVTLLWHVPPLWWYSNRYFVVSTAYPYAASIVGNIFSHQTFKHLGSNLLGGVLFAIPVHEEIGRGNFLALWTSSGILGALTSMYYYTFANRLGFYHFGCSGAVWGVMTSWVYFDIRKDHPPDDPSNYLRYARYFILGILTLGNFGTNILASTDVFAHIGGGAVGLVWAYVLAWRADRRGEVQAKEKSGVVRGA